MDESSEIRSSHAKLIENLKRELENEESGDIKLQILDEFSSNYLMPIEFWEKAYECAFNREPSVLEYYDDDLSGRIDKKATYHLFHGPSDENVRYKLFNHVISESDLPRNFKLYKKGDSEMVVLEKDLNVPHFKLRYSLMSLEEYSSRQISSQIFKRVEKFEKIIEKMKKNKSLKEFLDNLIEAEDNYYVKYNLENFIFQNLYEKDSMEAWKLYIEYLRENDPREMLQVYSKYCRFFLDDFEIKNEYKNATEKYGPVYVPWKNLFEFEKAIENDNDMIMPSFVTQDMIENKVKIIKIELPRVPYYLNNSIENGALDPPEEIAIKPPFFDFSFFNLTAIRKPNMPEPFIRYLIEFSNPMIRMKLQKTSKYFLSKFLPKLYIYRFLFTNKANLPLDFTEDSMHCSSMEAMEIFKFKQLCLSTSLSFTFDSNENALSQVIQEKLYRCNIKYFSVTSQKLTKNDFMFMVGSGNIESLYFNETLVFDEKEERIFLLEEILGFLPKIRKVIIVNERMETSNTLSNLKFTNKLILFKIKNIINAIDPIDFYGFIKQNSAPNGFFDLTFHDDFQFDLVNKFEKDIEKELKNFEPGYDRPQVTVHYDGYVSDPEADDSENNINYNMEVDSSGANDDEMEE